MKKLFFLLGVSFMVGGMLLSSCDGGKKLTPEDEVRNYGKNFVEKLSANQLDSLTASYPDLVNAESLVPVQSDTILVAETAPGQFDLTLAEGITLKVNRSDDGNITVAESKGLFTFPDDKVELAKKTGMWDDNLSDAQLNERLKDDDFFDYVKKSKTVNKKNLISVGSFKETPGQDEMGTYARDGYQIITNNSDVEINGRDYSFVYEEGEWWGWMEDKADVSTKTKPGKTIPPHGTVRAQGSAGLHSWSTVKSIKWNLNDEQIQGKFAPYTGNEYQEYLNSKK